MQELIEKFSMERVHKGGAKFDFEKAKWFNHQWLQKLPVAHYRSIVAALINAKGISIDEGYLDKVMNLVRDRCTLLPDFWVQGFFFFEAPVNYDEASVKPKWDNAKSDYFEALVKRLAELHEWSNEKIELTFKDLAAEAGIKIGDLQMIYRVMLVGAKMGPGVFIISSAIGKEETVKRIQNALLVFG